MLLNGHSQIAIAPETHYFRKYYRKGNRRKCTSSAAEFDRFVKFFLNGPEIRSFGFTENEQRRLYKQIASDGDRSHSLVLASALRQYGIKSGKSIWGDKTPSNALSIDSICNVFPNARIISMVRDPRDVVLSLSRISWHRGNVVQHAKEWRETAKILRAAVSERSVRVLCVRYEDLLEETETMLASICDFIGVEFEIGMLQYYRHAVPNFSVHEEPWKAKNLLPVDSRNKMKWKTAMPANQRVIIEKIVGPELEAFGYSRENERPKLSAHLTYSYLYFANLVCTAQYYLRSAWLRLSGSY